MKERFFSAPGRVEIGGNHTDHQRGRVLAAAVDLATRCAVKANGTNTARITADGFGAVEMDVSDLSVRENERGTCAALARGVAAWFSSRGFRVGGFDARVSSNVPAGAGLSSSAAFAVLIGTVFKGLFGGDASPLDIALAGQYAENVYFGKPCGLMDQTASSFGGVKMIDFLDPQNPAVTSVRADFSGYALCVVDTGGSHADLTHEYASVLSEMKTVAAHFGKECLREVPPDAFRSALRELRRYGDRPVLRALHFFEENERAANLAAALDNGDMPAFLDIIRESGRSSSAYLQNVYSLSAPQAQGLTLALALSEKILNGAAAEKGAWRVHGGGFAGTILAFVPDVLKDPYQKQMNGVFGDRCCHFVNIRETGGAEVFGDGRTAL